MRNVIFKFQFIIGLLLLACLNVQADDDLVTKQITIKLDKAGTLSGKIASTRKYKLTNLKIIGDINGTDFRLIREMAGRDFHGGETEGKLAILDLSEAKIVSGGDYYCYQYGDKYYTSNDTIGALTFYDCCGLTNIAIPSSVTTIGRDAFKGCSSLTNIAIPSSVTSIGGLAFAGCSGLISITIPSSVTKIDSRVFSGCSSLTNIAIPSNVTSIGESAFAGCSGLTSITIPLSVTKIGNSAFEDCCNLKSVYVSWETPISIDTSDKLFIGIDKKICTLYVPQGTCDEYFLSNWGDYFNNIVEYDVTGISHVTISGNVKEISRYSMNGQRLDAPTKGLNIVKYSDGSVKKVVIQ